MSKNVESFHLVDLSSGRRAMMNALDLASPKHYMYGLLEVDVSIAQKFIADQKIRTGEAYSFTGYLAYCLARAVDEHKEVQGYLKGRKKLIILDDVNVGVMVERKIGEKTVLMGHVIQGANHKSYREIHQEIRSAQSEPVPPGRGVPKWFSSALLLPWPLSGLVKTLMSIVMRQNPMIRISTSGTVFVTSVGMFGKRHSGWGVTTTPHSLSLVVGGISRKPVVVDEQIEPREILNLTVLFDHDVVDGAPATRFVRRLVELIESGYDLDDLDVIAY
ncbi:MAG TPA: 2-oxo acid dehydrogenase subunit E2 [Anaerolineales bacterium]|nr:2-oxo acid dehydrogenase subunit E2 [Anaerolineales bacterium]